jgi:hypothetical protein
LDELVQVGLFNILEDYDANSRLPDPLRHRRADPLLGESRDVQPQRQGDPQLKDRSAA